MSTKLFCRILIGIFITLVTPEFGFTQVIDLQTNGPERWGRINPVPGFNAQSLGVGNFTSPANSPKAVLHVNSILLPPSGTGQFTPGQLFRTDGPNTQANTWTMFTGPTAATSTEKGALFTGGNLNSSPNDFCMRASTVGAGSGDLVFYTQNNLERMRIKGGGGPQDGFIGVNRRFPLSMIHIDGAVPSTNPNSTFQAGWRPWMRVGVFNQWDSDALFVGLKNEGVNRKDAVIAWSDDAGGPPNGPDFLRFIYTNNTGATVPQGGGPNGIEVGRWSPVDGYFGIGNFYNSTVTQTPAVRLEILPNPLVTATTPTFRITQVQQNPGSPANTGIFTDMYTSPNGDLVILPRDNTQANSATAITKNRYVGINTGTPGNTVEINSQLISPTAGPGGTGNSGLRFSDLTIASATVTNPGLGVLAVDGNGDVIYVLGGGGQMNASNGLSINGTNGDVELGGKCGSAAPAALLDNREIPMANFNLVFTGQGITGNNIGIGTNCTPAAKLHVRQQSGAIPPVATPGAIGILSMNSDLDGVGVYSLSNGSATGPYRKIAGWFESTPSAGSPQVAIFVPFNGGRVFVGHPFGYTSLSLVDVNGTIEANNFTMPSDISLKHNVNTLGNSLEMINRLRPVTFEWNDTLDGNSLGLHSGFIAQEVDTIIPQVVSTGLNSLKGIAYIELIPYLVKAIQEQSAKIDSLETQLNSCCSSEARIQNPPPNQTDITLTNSESIVLNQNVPNPFAEQTTITYNLPESVTKAQLLFYDATGKLIKAVDLTGRGNGQINVFANDLSNGIYSYALVVDGQIADTKRMVKTQ